VGALDTLLELRVDVHRHLRVDVADLAHDPLDALEVQVLLGEKCWLVHTDSPTRRLADSPTRRLADGMLAEQGRPRRIE
jgi:hypothetical protein